MEIHGKAVASIESTDDDKFGPNGGFTAVLSTPSVDRDGDRLFREEWLDLPDWLPLDVDHGMSMEATVGKFHPYWDGDRLLMDAYFTSSDRAQSTRRDLNDLRDEATNTWPVGVSVAFMTDKSKKDGEPRRELLNAGIVAIPSNRDAKILDSKEVECAETSDTDEHTKDAPEGGGHWCQSDTCCEGDCGSDGDVDIMSVQEAETKAPAGTGDTAALTQAIHDASVHLGAMCYPLVSDEDETGASSGANKSVDEPEVEPEEKSPEIDLEAIKPEGMTMEQFEAALKQLLTPESPEEPAPAVEAAAASPAEDWARKTALMRMRVRTRL